MKYFKTDGIRGEAYTAFTLEIACLVGKYYEKSEKDVIIGIDTRESSIDFAKAIYSGLSNKRNVKFAGVIPTPGLMYYSLKNNCIAIMVTASHNTYKDNGIKVITNGMKIERDEMNLIEDFIEENKEAIYTNTSVDINTILDLNIINTYKLFLKEKIKIKQDPMVFS